MGEGSIDQSTSQPFTPVEASPANEADLSSPKEKTKTSTAKFALELFKKIFRNFLDYSLSPLFSFYPTLQNARIAANPKTQLKEEKIEKNTPHPKQKTATVKGPDTKEIIVEHVYNQMKSQRGEEYVAQAPARAAANSLMEEIRKEAQENSNSTEREK